MAIGQGITAFRTEDSRHNIEHVDARVRQLDELQRISREARDRYLGPNHFTQVRELYDITDAGTSTPSFRPYVRVPQLQVLMLAEATDLSDATPRAYIFNRKTGKRDDPRERAFQNHWQQSFVNEELLMAQLWSLFSGLGYLQVGFDFAGRGGRGEVWIQHRDPSTVFPDPAAKHDRNEQGGWAYVVIEDRLYPGQIARLYPETGKDFLRRAVSSSSSPVTLGGSADEAGYGFEMPPGPMSSMGYGGRQTPTGDGRVVVRTAFLLDDTVEVVRDFAGADAAEGVEKLRPLYPTGRFIVEAEGRILADGANPVPLGWFPLIRVLGLPALKGFFPPPPVRFTLDLQRLAERMLTQTYENAVRLNNGIWFIDEKTGITAEDFGGLPAEVRIINSDSRPPQAVWPEPMPQHFVELPTLLLQLQRELQGFTPSRAGQPGAGNISPDLFEASVLRSQTLTRLRGRLLARSVQRLAELMFRMMAKFYVHDEVFYTAAEQFDQQSADQQPASWNSLKGVYDEHEIQIDPASIKPVSQAALRSIVPELRQLGLIDPKTALELLEVPDAERIAELIRNERVLAAISAVRDRRR